MADVLVVTSKVKEACKAAGCNTAGDFAEALSAKVAMLIQDAARRAQANNRKTVRADDL